MKELFARMLFDALISLSTKALGTALDIDKKFGFMAKMQPPPLTPEPAAVIEKKITPFTNGRGDEIPGTFEGEHPEYHVFKLMFERKLGFGGKFPLTIAGQQRHYTVDELYEFMTKLHRRPEEEKGQLERAVYAAVMNMIIKDWGSNVETKQLN